MSAIESQLAGPPGLYRWTGGELKVTDRLQPGDPALAKAATEGPLLVFIHGTGSHTRGGFKDLFDTGPKKDWETLTRPFGDRVFGFEHPTFSESPIENALALAKSLPAGARLSLVTHSRGGLVGDLLCLGGLDEELIGRYQHALPPNVQESETQHRLREKLAAEEQDQLRQLKQLLEEKNFRIERLRARGVSGPRHHAAVGQPGRVSLRAALAHGQAGRRGGRTRREPGLLRLQTHRAGNRPQADRPAPGAGHRGDADRLAAGRSPRPAPRKPGVQMAVIAGDIEGGGFLKRLGVMFTDWMLFDSRDNDLVVNTDSMYGGLASSGDTGVLFDQGEEVNHFHYFRNPRTRTALRDWLTAQRPERCRFSNRGKSGTSPPWRRPGSGRRRGRRGAPGSRPTLGRSLSSCPASWDRTCRLAHNRVWFDLLELVGGGLKKIRFGTRDVRGESLFEMFYGDLADHLEATHAVVPFPYDWRRPIEETAKDLAERRHRATGHASGTTRSSVGPQHGRSGRAGDAG